MASAGDVNADGYADILIGAPGYNKDETDEGAAFLWLGSATGIADGNPANAHATFESNQGISGFGDSGAALGQSVSSTGDLNGDGYADIVIGAPDYDVQNQREGSAFVFLGSPTGIASGTPATAHVHLERDFAANARMGQSVAAGGDINGDGFGDILIGGEETDRVLMYFGSAAGLPNAGSVGPNVQLAAQVNGQRYGSAVASAGDVNGDGFDDVLVGARMNGAGGQSFVYHGGHAAPVVKANGTFFTGPLDALVFPRTFPTDPAVRVASAGDVNGDGFADVVVGVPDYDNGEADEGAAFVYLGSSAGWIVGDSSTAHARFESNQAGAQFGERVASAGDVNGDGFADLIVGAPRYDAPEADEGAAFVFLGSATGFTNGDPASAHARLESNQPGAMLGRVASAGDVDGDGYSDIVVGAPLYDSPEIDEGAAFVFRGSAGGLINGNPTTAHARFESNLASSQLGWSANSAGDVNGDGFDDLIVGAPYYSATFSQGGGAFVFHGSPSGLTSGHPGTATSRIQSIETNALLGYSVDSAGDFNGDGYADVVVGAPTVPAFVAADQGNAYVFVGSPTGIGERSPSNAYRTLVGSHPNPTFFAYRFGQDVAGAGDLDNDGFGDVVSSSVLVVPSGPLFFRFALIHSGAPIATSLPARASRFIIGEAVSLFDVPTADANASAAGDVNGDGIGDLIVGGGLYNGERAANVYYGNGRGRFVGLRQLRSTGGGGTLPLGGSANATDRFSFSLDVTSPRGRERARIEIELCAAGLPFGHPSCIRPVPVPFWLDLGLEGFSTTGGILGLVPDQRYSWRARAQYVPFSGTQPGIVPIIKNGPWFRVQGRATPGDFRTLPEPGMAVGLVVGGLAIAQVGKRRRPRATEGRPRGSRYS